MHWGFLCCITAPRVYNFLMDEDEEELDEDEIDEDSDLDLDGVLDY